ncbi:Rha family transcriptional regulator [Vibrio crassostreae]|uniref:Rha family transcriptional regulator n=1 Tax=Vibrio crassostreae TaxID=246167 RepID=UPI001B302224|nr:Rha family transcriptional regulator [Vibrio crassostreae]CAK2871934.1 Rha family transcriptional regulator [Vibrio crassostreae]
MTTLSSPIASATSSDLVFVSSTNDLVTDSLHIAKYFGKEHKNVLRKIRALECSEEFRSAHFCAYPYTNEQNGETYTTFQMTKDGFMFLVMGFSGKRAAEIKERYIGAFNDMQKQLTVAQPTSAMLPQQLRLLTIMEYGQVVGTSVVPNDAMIFSRSEIPALLSESGYFNSEQLVEIAQAANTQLIERAKHGYF